MNNKEFIKRLFRMWRSLLFRERQRKVRLEKYICRKF